MSESGAPSVRPAFVSSPHTPAEALPRSKSCYCCVAPSLPAFRLSLASIAVCAPQLDAVGFRLLRMLARLRSPCASLRSRRSATVSVALWSNFSSSSPRTGPKRVAEKARPAVVLDEYGIERRPLPPLGLDGRPKKEHAAAPELSAGGGGECEISSEVPSVRADLDLFDSVDRRWLRRSFA